MNYSNYTVPKILNGIILIASDILKSLIIEKIKKYRMYTLICHDARSQKKEFIDLRKIHQ